MLKSAAALAAILMFTAAAQAGDRRDRDYYAPPPPASYGGTVNNYYGSVMIYQGGQPGYSADYSSAAPAYGYGTAQSGAYAGAWAGAYGDSSGYGYYDYGTPWGQPFARGVGTSPYGNYGGYGYGAAQPPVYSGARMDPWNGYNGGFGNGYW